MKKKTNTFKAGTYGETTDYDQFKSIPNNRGIKNGLDRKRIDKHKDDIENGRYVDMGWDVLTNIFGDITDGMHRKVAKMELGLPIRYYVTTTKSLNNRNKKTRFITISYINSHNSQWTKKGTYKGSLKQKLPLALGIEKLIDEVSGETGLITNKIPVSWMFSLIKSDIKYFNSSKELNTAEVYNDNKLLKYTKTVEFRNDFDIFIELINVFNNKVSRFNNITKYILDLHWSNSNFDINHMLTNLGKYTFKVPDKPNADEIKREIEKVYNARKGYKNFVRLF